MFVPGSATLAFMAVCMAGRPFQLGLLAATPQLTKQASQELMNELSAELVDTAKLGSSHLSGSLHHQHKHANHHHANHRHQPHHKRSRKHPQSQRGYRGSRAVYLATIDQNSRLSAGQNQDLSDLNQYQHDQPPILDQCCACDEAKYELVFEGLWSRYTHPDDFPENYWQASFSDIIGASHSNEFKMWQQDTYASEGVKDLAETGSTKKLEAELKQVSSKTRTIIKARELRYPTLNSKTSALFRTDRQHHLVSILSKLNPSPDWMVGVSSLELCQPDCSWAQQRVLNLHLWDAGTDSGNTFTAPDSPSRPQEKVHPYRKDSQTISAGPFPNSTSAANSSGFAGGDTPTYHDENSSNYRRRSPNYQETPANMSQAELDIVSRASSPQSSISDQVKPFARLSITRQRIYEKSCNADPVTTSQTNQRYPSQTHHQSTYSSQNPTISWTIEPQSADCRFTEWSDWSTCSSICGKGIRTRTRALLDERAQLAGCSQVDLIEKEICLSECVGNVTCVMRDWSEWSKCSVNCGQGYKKRTRSPIGPLKRACESVDLVEMEPCVGSQCGPDQSACEVTDWSQWSDCSVACGKGTRIRTRQYVKKESAEVCSARLIQKQSCNGRPELCKQSPKDHCTQPVDRGPCKARIERWHYDKSSGMCERFMYGGCLGAGSTFQHQQLQQISNPRLPVIDCKLSAWSPWSTCSALCGEGRRTRSRYIIQMPQNGGKACDKKLSRTQKCKDLPLCPPGYNQPSFQKQIGSNAQKGFGRQQLGSAKNHNSWRTSPVTSSTTTASSSLMEDEDDSKFSRLIQSANGLGLLNTGLIPAFKTYETPSKEMELIGSSSFHIKNGYVVLNLTRPYVV